MNNVGDFDKLFQQEIPKLRAFAKRRGVAEADIDDLISITCTRVFVNFKPDIEVQKRTYLYGAMKYTLMEYFRDKKNLTRRGVQRLRTVSTDAIDLGLPDNVAFYDAVDNGDFKKQMGDLYGSNLWTIVKERMTDKEFVVFSAMFDGMSAAQAGKILGVSESRAHQLYHSGIQRIRRFVEATEQTGDILATAYTLG